LEVGAALTWNRSSSIRDAEGALKMTRDELLRIFNERPHKLRDLPASGVDLRGCHLADISFENSNFSGAILSNCDLDSAIFNDCCLDRTALDGANLWKARFYESSLQSANLSGANLCRSSFQSSSLQCANLQNVDFTRAGFHDIDLREADLTGAIFFETVMERVRAHGARGAWFRPGDNRIEQLDMSEAGDGSDMRDASTLIDRTHGKPRPLHVRLSASLLHPVMVREEPNAREYDVDIDTLPIDEKLRAALRAWEQTRFDAYRDVDTADDADRTKLDGADQEGRRLWCALRSSLKDHRIRYEPPHEGAAIEEAPEEDTRA
jgi:uncharacterized protein YjbI with pentapeptide repeats